MSGRQTAQVDLGMVDIALVLAVDCSGSISNERMTLQIEGYATAIASPAFVRGVMGLPLGRVALTYVAWSNFDRQQQMVPWQVIDGPAGAQAFAEALRTATRPGAGYTSLSGAIDYAAAELARHGRQATRRVIDLSADGINNDGRPVTAARDAAVAAGITINGLPILELDANLERYFREEVIGGPDAFAVVARDVESLAASIQRKLLSEIS